MRPDQLELMKEQNGSHIQNENTPISNKKYFVDQFLEIQISSLDKVLQILAPRISRHAHVSFNLYYSFQYVLINN